MALAASAGGWLFFGRLLNISLITREQVSGWLVLAYLVVLVMLAGVATLGYSVLLSRSDHSFEQALQRLARTVLPRLSSALSKLSEGDLTVQIDEEIPQLNAVQYPGVQELVPI